MNCDLIKEKLIDYIEGDIGEDERIIIKNHLDNCEDCRREYHELIEAISYLQASGDNIKTDKNINIDPRRSKKNKKKGFKRSLLIASIITIFIAVTAFGAELLSYLEYWKLASVEKTMAWDELIDAGLGQKLDISVEDSGVRVTAEGVIADDLNTLILLKIEDLNGETKFSDGYNIKDGINIAESIEASGDLKQFSDFMLPTAIPVNLYQEEEGVNRMIIQMDTMTKDKGKIKLKIREFMSLLEDEEEFNPGTEVDESLIKRVKGNWDMEIEAEKLKTYKYKIDKEMLVDGNEIKINNIIIAPTETSIEYEFRVFNKEEKYFVNSVRFSIEHKGKTYKYPKLGISNYHSYLNNKNGPIYNSGVTTLETIYLENPDSIDLILNSYRYNTKEKKSYVLDLDNLPQELEYGNSILTVEAIRNTGDLSEIIIREDDSQDREYISTSMYMDFPLILNDGSESSIRSYSPIYSSHDTERLVRQEMSMVKMDEEKEGHDADGFYDNIKTVLNPERIVIEGQAYIKTPNKKINIELKK